MELGNLTDRIVFERKTVALAGDGDLVTTWTPNMTTWADVEILSGAQQVDLGKTTSENRIKVKLLYRQDDQINVGDRVTWRSRRWIIEDMPVVDKSKTWVTMIAIIENKTTNMVITPSA